MRQNEHSELGYRRSNFGQISEPKWARSRNLRAATLFFTSRCVWTRSRNSDALEGLSVEMRALNWEFPRQKGLVSSAVFQDSFSRLFASQKRLEVGFTKITSFPGRRSRLSGGPRGVSTLSIELADESPLLPTNLHPMFALPEEEADFIRCLKI